MYQPVNLHVDGITAVDHSIIISKGFVAPSGISRMEEFGLGKNPLPHNVFVTIREGLLTFVCHLLRVHDCLNG